MKTGSVFFSPCHLKRRRTTAVFFGSGFTLIELLVVIAIITILAAIIIASVRTAVTKARIARVRTDIAQFVRMVVIAQGNTGKPLTQITSNGCSDCVCRDGLSHIGDTGACYTTWVNSLTLISNASDGYLANSAGLYRDPWGSPFMLDENETEGGNCSVYDSFLSAGPDGIRDNSDDVFGQTIPHSVCP